MWIRTIAVEHWRGLTYTLDNLEPGLNLIAGPNESGKSRLVQALRCALFETTKGQAEHKKALASWGVGAASPRVRVVFELAGTEWTLEKVFLDRGHNTRLRSAGQTLDGEAAEAHLAELLGVGIGGRTASRREDRGVWALLWVEQGESREQPAHTSTTQSRILDQLTQEIGEAAAGEFGAAVLRRAEEYRSRFYTAARGTPTKALIELAERVSTLQAEHDDAVARREAIARTADALVAKRQSEKELEDRLTVAERQLAEVANKYKAAEALRHRCEIAAEQVRTAESARTVTVNQRNEARALAQALERLVKQIDDDTAATGTNTAVLEKAQRAVTDSTAAVTELDAKLEACEASINTLRRRERAVRQREALEGVTKRLDAARRIDARLLELRQELAALPKISDDDLVALRAALTASDEARARLEGASVSLELTALQDLDVDGESLASGASRRIRVDDDRQIEIDGLLSIGVSPGGGELVRLRDAARDAVRSFTLLLARHGVDDVGAAEQVVRNRRERDNEIKRLDAELSDRAPEGIDELVRQVAELKSALDASVTEPDEASEPFDPAALVSAETDRQALNRSLQAARARRDAESERLAEVRERQGRLQAKLESLQAERARIEARRASMPDDEALENLARAAERSFAEKVTARDEALRQFEAVGGDALAQDLERSKKSVDQLRTARDRTAEERTRLEATLDASGDAAYHEKVQDLAAELASAQADHARLQREAAAALRLHDVLAREYSAARERLSRPVIERIRPYLVDVFPGAEVWLDDELGLQGLRTHHADEAFDQLSGGAREQLSLLARIGLAEVLGSSESWPLVLDDVLVNTDAERIRRMHRALYNAGRKMQILLFTCHGALFDGLGPDARFELPHAPRGLEIAAGGAVNANGDAARGLIDGAAP